MTIREPLSQAKRDRIVALAREGVPRNQIAREVGISVGSVSKYAKAAGVSFDRRATASATAAARVDNAARREELAVEILTRISSAVSDLQTTSPNDMREHEQRARALHSLGQGFANVSRVVPTGDASVEVIRQGLHDFMGVVTALNDANRQLAMYEAKHGQLEHHELDEASVDWDSYGRPSET